MPVWKLKDLKLTVVGKSYSHNNSYVHAQMLLIQDFRLEIASKIVSKDYCVVWLSLHV